MKRILAVCLLVVMLFGVVACDTSGAGEPSASSSGSESTFDIGSVSASVSGSASQSLSYSAGIGASTSVLPSDSSSSGEGDEPATPSSYIPVIVDGVMQYEIVYENSAIDHAVTFIKELERLGIKDTSGRTFSSSNYTDFCTRDTRIKNNNTPEKKQIYIGNTLFEESKTVGTDLRYRDYVVKQVGNKIVVVAGSAETLTTAVSACLVLGVRKSLVDNTRSVTAKTSNANYVLKDVTICGVPLKSFTILYADGSITVTNCGVKTTHTYEEYAKELQARLRNDYGYELTVKKASSTTEGANEILVGPTNRSLSAAISTPKEQHYTLKTQGTQVALKCFGHSSYAYVDDAFAKYLKRAADTEGVTAVAAGVTHTALSGAIDHQDIATKDGTVRFMSFNVLSQLQSWKPAGEIAPTVAERKEAFLGLLHLAQADIIGFQEVTGGETNSWANLLPQYVKNTEYSLILRDMSEKSSGSPLTSGHSGTCYNVIAYNKNKFKPVAYGVHAYSTRRDTATLRNVGWVLFEGLSGTPYAGLKFIFMNGHWDYADTTTGSRSYQRKQGTELGEKINLLVQKYNCPVIAVADYNCPRDKTELDVDGQPMNQAVTNLCTKGNMVDSRILAQEKNAISSSDAMPGGTVDHIFVRKDKGTECLFFKVLTENGIAGLSDHKPLIADLKLR